ncbi:MAG TPA: trypsin-like peptidase domain-containing protein [Vicinamibacteria bacterium]|nr:trypsin-like peptidase domain-containing protein [Vicinamibacteria bacterium]
MRLLACVPVRLAILLLAAAAAGLGSALAETGQESPPAGTAEAGTRVENAVVRVFATVRDPDVFKPWAKQTPREIVGSGVVIDGKRILTNAHVVRYASQIQVQGNHAGDKLSARVKALAPGIDLAVLELDDAGFFDTHAPLERASTLPSVKDSVLALGFPTGGTSLSITKGIVSRIEFTSYNWPVSGLRIQIDAAINPGNSGGPAVVGDKMIGLVFSHLGGAQNIGYIIPCEEIELFLADIADGRYDGKPALFDNLQTLENEGLRTFLKLDRSIKGMVVNEPDSADPGYPLKKWDVISKIGDTPIDDQGMVELAGGLRVRFRYLVQKIAKDGKVPLTIWRGGKELTIHLPASPKRPLLIRDLQADYPPYFVYGPLVFSTATTQLMVALAGGQNKSSWLPGLSFGGSPLVTRGGDRPAFAGEELVVVSSPPFPHKLAQGYSNPITHVVKAVNGTKIGSLRQLVEVLRDLRDEFVTFEFAGRGAESLVFPRKETMAATEEILTDNGIRSQGSPDLLALWNGSRAPKPKEP